ncbi:MAG: thioredoxin [Gammaproteobacteria bacterium]|jgi:thioredoxin-like negative regulator of GroEL|nr:thioredoxin [Gammaproteobacteria bacterium]MBU0787190.1 thioredoxin [Gammaproteobacteria bacterium]MBU0814197.1 thioredoxin [Gammaproteobacteria bacterium]MBU1786283.1 thioredoxin [Gammaproteobacteria bacterium]
MNQLLVVALCAEWCGVCREFRQQWDAHDFSTHAEVSYLWVDIEDRADIAGDLDIETFPSLAVFSGQQPVFYGPVSPNMDLLQRVSQSSAVQRFDADVHEALTTLRAGLSLGR